MPLLISLYTKLSPPLFNYQNEKGWYSLGNTFAKCIYTPNDVRESWSSSNFNLWTILWITLPALVSTALKTVSKHTAKIPPPHTHSNIFFFLWVIRILNFRIRVTHWVWEKPHRTIFLNRASYLEFCIYILKNSNMKRFEGLYVSTH